MMTAEQKKMQHFRGIAIIFFQYMHSSFFPLLSFSLLLFLIKFFIRHYIFFNNNINSQPTQLTQSTTSPFFFSPSHTHTHTLFFHIPLFFLTNKQLKLLTPNPLFFFQRVAFIHQFLEEEKINKHI